MTNTKKIIKAYAYIRVSTSMQVEGYSLEAQENEIKRYAKNEGITIVNTYADEGISGKNIEKRTQFKKMMDDIVLKKDNISYVLIFKLSRFGRNAADILSSIQKMQDYNINLISVNEKLDSSTDSGKIMISVLSIMAEIERENILTQTMAGRKQKAIEGGWNGGFAPYGYYLDNGNLYIAEDEAEAIRKIFDLYVNENLGVAKISRKLEALGIEKKIRQNGKLKVFSAHFIKGVLDNPVYCGRIAFGRRKSEKIEGKRNEFHVVKEQNEDDIIIAKGKHEGIVSEELWDEAHQKRVATGGKREKREKEHEYILSGLIKCPACGKPMYGVPSRKPRKDGSISVSYAYACRQNSNATGHKCPNPRQYDCKKIDSFVSDLAINRLSSNPHLLEKLMKSAEKEFDETELLKELLAYEEKLQKLENNEKGIKRKINDLDFSDDENETIYESLTEALKKNSKTKKEIEKEYKKTRKKIEELNERKNNWENSLEFLLDVFLDYPKYSDAEKKKLMQMIVRSVEIYPTKRELGYFKSVEFKFPVFSSNMGGDPYVESIWEVCPVDTEGWRTDAETFRKLSARVYGNRTTENFPPYETTVEGVVQLVRKTY